MNVLTLAALGPGSSPYKLLLVIHIIAVATAFGVPLAYGAISRASRERPGADGRALALINVQLQGRAALPALIIAAVAGLGLVGLSNEVWSFSDTWVSASFAVVIALIVVSAYLLLPALKRSAEASGTEDPKGEAGEKAKAQTAMATGLLHLGLVVTIVLMVWKPGA